MLKSTEMQGSAADYFFLCAGQSIPGEFLSQPIEDFKQGMDLNYFGSLYSAQLAAQSLVKNEKTGKIVFVSSTLGLISFYGYSQYAPTKHALRGS